MFKNVWLFSFLIIYLQKFHRADWLRARQFFPIWNWVQKVEIKLIDRKVAKAQQNKMAGRSGESDDILI